MQAIACIVWTSSYIYTNEHKFNVFEVNIAKGIVGVILNYIIIRLRGNGIKFEQPKYHKWLLIINSFVLLYFFALPLAQLYLPLPVVHTIGCSSIALVYMFDYFLYNAKITNIGLIGVGFAFFGVVLMANNRFILNLISPNE